MKLACCDMRLSSSSSSSSTFCAVNWEDVDRGIVRGGEVRSGAKLRQRFLVFRLSVMLG